MAELDQRSSSFVEVFFRGERTKKKETTKKVSDLNGA